MADGGLQEQVDLALDEYAGHYWTCPGRPGPFASGDCCDEGRWLRARLRELSDANTANQALAR